MRDPAKRRIEPVRLVHWVARLSAAAVVWLLMAMALGGDGSGPRGWMERAYLAFFPFGFSAGYLIGWLRPLLGGAVSLACVALSLVVIGRLFPWSAYAIWAVLSAPGVLYLWVGLRRRGEAPAGGAPTPV